MPGAVKKVRNANGSGGPCCFNGGKTCGVVYYVIGQEDFGSPARLEIARRGIIQAAEYSDAGEQQDVLAVPEAVLSDRR